MRNYRNTSIIFHFDNGYQKSVVKNKLKIRHADKVKQFNFLFMTNTSYGTVKNSFQVLILP